MVGCPISLLLAPTCPVDSGGTLSFSAEVERVSDGDTGLPTFDGGGRGDQMPLVRRFQTPIVAKGRIVVAADDQLVVFTP